MNPILGPTLHLLEADKGDCFIISWENDGQQECLVVDCGVEKTYIELRSVIERFGKITALIITHVDYDHIGGLFTLLSEDPPSGGFNFPIFMNTPNYALFPSDSEKVKLEDGIEMDQILREKNIKVYSLVAANSGFTELSIAGLKLIILSPTVEVLDAFITKWNAKTIKEDYELEQIETEEKVANRQAGKPISNYFQSKEVFHKVEGDLINASSIACIAEVQGIKYLLLGDSHPAVIEKVLRQKYNEQNKLIVDVVKVSHHGSKFNTSRSLLSIIKTRNYIISTNGSGPYYHPHKETIAKFIELAQFDGENINIFLNYDIADEILTESECLKYNVTLKVKNELNRDEFSI